MTTRIHPALDELVRLQFDARGFSLLPQQPVSSLLSGRHASRLRGRGLTFEELREPKMWAKKSRTECHSVQPGVACCSIHRPGTDCRFLRTDCQSVLLFLIVLSAAPARAAKTIDAQLAQESAWTGEAVSLVITLYSPGPFSGTASFGLPELPQTVFMRTGNPVVGSETVDGESLLTQRHEFLIYTQRAGQVVVPPFPIRFAAKQTFTGNAQPIEVTTPEMRFESKRPPGSESFGVVIAAREMEIRQSWLPDVQQPLQAGDVIQRTVERTASGTTAMMFPPVRTSAPDHVRVYTADPIVEDTNNRGQITAKRVETMKYQFQAPGTFQLPPIEFAWWDSATDELKSDLARGLTVTVEGEHSSGLLPVPEERASRRRLTMAAVVIASLIGWWLLKPAKQLVTKLQARWNSPEAVAARSVKAACRANDAAAAYAALLRWKRARTVCDSTAKLDSLISAEAHAQLQREWSVLSRYVFGNQAVQPSWSGTRLREVFSRVRRELMRSGDSGEARWELPQLNPTA